jgi:hypothetical protein
LNKKVRGGSLSTTFLFQKETSTCHSLFVRR